MVPIWQRDKKDVTEEEYETFYRDKFFDYNKPLRTIHYNVEGNVSFKALLYIPGKAPYDFYTKDYKRGLQLYSSGVLIMDNCEDLLPEHFRFVRGVVDSQDLSLNISREMLQHNRQLTIIARNIEKKIKSELKAMLENDREKYEEFYAAFGRQLKYGTVSDYGAHKEATQDLLLFYSHKQGKLVSLKEYVDAMAEGQEKIYYAPGENKERLSKLPQVETLTKKGYDVLLFTEDVDEFVPQTLMTYMEKPFCNVSTEDLGLQTEEEKKQAEEKAEKMKGLLTFVKETLGDRVKEVKLSSELGSHPVCMTPAEGMSFEMEKYMKRANPEFAFPVGRVLELNPEHEAVQAMQKAMTEDPEKAKDYCGAGLKRVCELAGIPPVLHMGSCVDISRMMILASDLAKDWGINISQIPLCGCAPEWMSEKAVSIGNYVVATGIDTYLGVDPYSKGSSEITELLQGETRGCKEWVEAHFVVDTNIESLGDKMIAAIEAKRAALGI